MNEVTVTNEHGEVIAHIFIDDESNEVKAIVTDNVTVDVDGQQLK